ncbi:hypothetical protein OH492_28640 [Vibrio chagasii]|nr:hypothetical protein [Vibrio chagasii]
MMYGIRDCMKFGDAMKTVTYQISFSMSSAADDLQRLRYRACNVLAWLFRAPRHQNRIRQSNDGVEVTAWQACCYAIGKYLPQDEEGSRARSDKYFPVLEKPHR